GGGATGGGAAPPPVGHRTTRFSASGSLSDSSSSVKRQESSPTLTLISSKVSRPCDPSVVQSRLLRARPKNVCCRLFGARGAFDSFGMFCCKCMPTIIPAKDCLERKNARFSAHVYV
ncbi:unnamed protein product, partial [Callosobruchus maculatus]